MDNKQKDLIIQKCFAISGLTNLLGQLSLLKDVNPDKFDRIEKVQEKCIEELIDIAKSLQ